MQVEKKTPDSADVKALQLKIAAIEAKQREQNGDSDSDGGG